MACILIFKKLFFCFSILGIITMSSCSHNEDMIIENYDEKTTILNLNLKILSENGTEFSRTSSVRTDMNEYIKTLRAMFFSTDGNIVYNVVYNTEINQTWGTQIKIKPGSYQLYILANENKETMEQALNSINTLSDLFSATCLKKIKRDLGYSTAGNYFLMQGKKLVNISEGTDEQTEVIELTRLMAKVEITFSNHLAEGEFQTFSLGNYPEYFSVFQNLFYEPSENDNDTGKIWESNITEGNTYVYYIPPYHYSAIENTDGKKIHFTFKWLINSRQYTKSCPFRESDEATDIFDVKSNYHYKYNIRLINKPKDPLVIECKVIPWVKEEEVHYYANGECNLSIEKKIENGKSSLQLTLQNINEDPSFDMSNYYIDINYYFGYNYDVYINGTYINSAEAWNNGSYKYYFRNKDNGKSTIVIKPSDSYTTDWEQKYGDCIFNNYKIDLERLN